MIGMNGMLSNGLHGYLQMGYVDYVGVVPFLSKAKGLVAMFSFSVLLVGELMNIQDRLEMPRCKPVKPNKTRWNSTFDMITWLLVNKLVVQTFDIGCDEILRRAQLPPGSRYGDCQMLAPDWDLLSQLVRGKSRVFIFGYVFCWTFFLAFIS